VSEHAAGVEQIIPVYQDPMLFWQRDLLPSRVIGRFHIRDLRSLFCPTASSKIAILVTVHPVSGFQTTV
jgi:hypothetical protein